MELQEIINTILGPLVIITLTILWRRKYDKMVKEKDARIVEKLQHISELQKTIRDLTGRNGYPAYETAMTKELFGIDIEDQVWNGESGSKETFNGILSKMEEPKEEAPKEEECKHNYIPLSYSTGITVYQCSHCGEIPPGKED
jgi:hypothetical protein